MTARDRGVQRSVRRRTTGARPQTLAAIFSISSWQFIADSLRTLAAAAVTEGEDKPLKYPPIFNGADVAIITKVDLAAVVEFDRGTALKNIQTTQLLPCYLSQHSAVFCADDRHFGPQLQPFIISSCSGYSFA
jgi:hypothetical protein